MKKVISDIQLVISFCLLVLRYIFSLYSDSLYIYYIFFLIDKIKRFLSEFYEEDDAGKKVFKYGEQLVSEFGSIHALDL